MYDEHVRKRGFAIVGVVALLAIGALLYNSGWSQGFALGVLTGGADGTALAPYLAYRGGLHGAGGFFGAIFRFGFVLLMLALFAKFLGFWHWRRHGEGGAGPQGHWRHGPWHYGPCGEQSPQPPQTAQPESQSQTGQSGGPDQPSDPKTPSAQ